MIYTPKHLTKTFLILLLVAGLFSCNRQRDINLKALLEDAQKLDEVAEEIKEENKKFVRQLHYYAEDRGNKCDEVELVNNAEKANQYKNSIYKFIKKINDSLILNSSVKDQNIKVSTEKQMIESGHIRLLFGKVEEFRRCYSNKDSNIFYNQIKEQLSSKSYTSLQLLTLATLKTKILMEENKFLQELIKSFDDKQIRFDKVNVEVIAESNIVEEGKIYKAKIIPLMCCSNNKSLIKSITCQGVEISIDSNGVGKIGIETKVGKFNKNGLCKRTIRGEINIYSFNDTSIGYINEYQIRKKCY